MAKARSIIKLRGTVGGITFVDSVYGLHARAPRGTYTPITMSEGMKESSARQTAANAMAKILFDSVNVFAPGFKDGKLWSRMVQIFRKQQKLNQGISYSPFNKFEMRLDYRSFKLGSFRLGDQTANSATISFDLSDKNSESDLSLTLLRIAADDSLLIVQSTETDNSILSCTIAEGDAVFDFSELRADASCLYVLKIERMEAGEVDGLKAGKSVVFFAPVSYSNAGKVK